MLKPVSLIEGQTASNGTGVAGRVWFPQKPGANWASCVRPTLGLNGMLSPYQGIKIGNQGNKEN
jgi:hypothetical protein